MSPTRFSRGWVSTPISKLERPLYHQPPIGTRLPAHPSLTPMPRISISVGDRTPCWLTKHRHGLRKTGPETQGRGRHPGLSPFWEISGPRCCASPSSIFLPLLSLSPAWLVNLLGGGHGTACYELAPGEYREKAEQFTLSLSMRLPIMLPASRASDGVLVPMQTDKAHESCDPASELGQVLQMTQGWRDAPACPPQRDREGGLQAGAPARHHTSWEPA